MNWIKVKTLDFQPLVNWLVKQRTEVVLLLIQCGLGVYVACLMIPDALDRQERIANQVQLHHMNQLKEVSRQYQADQARDAKERELLIQKLTSQQDHEPNPRQNVAKQR